MQGNLASDDREVLRPRSKRNRLRDVPAASYIQPMMSSAELAEIGFLVGDPARATMLSALMDGRALTAGELAFFARVTPQTASLHLRKLTDANLLAVVNQGRHRYFRLASPLVGRMIEIDRDRRRHPDAAALPPPLAGRHRAAQCTHVLRPSGRPARRGNRRFAGRPGFVVLGDEGGEVSPEGFGFFGELGIDLGARRTRAAPSAGPVSIGPSDASISAASWAQRWRATVSSMAGSGVFRTVGRWRDAKGRTELWTKLAVDLDAQAKAA